MTRMWLIPLDLMCQQHRLGEHYELHKLAGGFASALNGDDGMRKRIAGQARDGNIDVRLIVERHDELEAYHGWDSPLPWTPADAPNADLSFAEGDIDIDANRRDICQPEHNCSEPSCAELMEIAA